MSIALQNVTESSPPSQKEPQQTKLCQSIVKILVLQGLGF